MESSWSLLSREYSVMSSEPKRVDWIWSSCASSWLKMLLICTCRFLKTSGDSFATGISCSASARCVLSSCSTLYCSSSSCFSRSPKESEMEIVCWLSSKAANAVTEEFCFAFDFSASFQESQSSLCDSDRSDATFLGLATSLVDPHHQDMMDCHHDCGCFSCSIALCMSAVLSPETSSV